MKPDAEEKEILQSVERGECQPVKGTRRERNQYARYARGTLRKIDRYRGILADLGLPSDIEHDADREIR